ncbi:MAG: hypothetical protein PWP45_643 [Tepidanaerobacteraceae bacterium]|nr:hypothetical protein [Tepidanaerobacteraceae bacterium]
MLHTLRPIIKQIEYYLFNYPALREELAKAKEDIFSLKAHWPDKPPTGSPSNPTEKAVTLYESKYGKAEKWLNLIVWALHIAGAEDPAMRKLVELRYFNGKEIEEIARELHIDPVTCERWQEDFLVLVVLLAVEEGLISVKQSIQESPCYWGRADDG